MLPKFITRIERFLRREDGPTLVEYAVMLMLIVLLSVSAIQIIGGVTANTFNRTEQIFSK